MISVRFTTIPYVEGYSRNYPDYDIVIYRTEEVYNVAVFDGRTRPDPMHLVYVRREIHRQKIQEKVSGGVNGLFRVLYPTRLLEEVFGEGELVYK